MDVRPIECADVLGRPPRDSFEIVSPADFRPGAWATIDPDEPPPEFVPYCLHLPERRSLYVKAGDIGAVRRAKMHYQHLRRRSTAVLRMPWERGRLYSESSPPTMFVFSVGRCGSTLLYEAMRSCGVFSLSEPDFFTQAVGISVFIGAHSPAIPQVTAAAASLAADLVAACGGSASPQVLIKLRTQCCKGPQIIVPSGGDSPRTIFMIREFEPWAASTLRASARLPDTAIRRYVEGLQCLRWLKRHSDCHLIRYEDLVEWPRETIMKAGRALMLSINADGLTRALESDSQTGTGLSRKRMAGRAIEPGVVQKAIEIWRDVRPTKLLAELGLADYC